MSFQPFQNLIQKAANKYGIGREFTAIGVCQNFRNIIPDLFDNKADAASHISPAHYKNGTLTINTDSPAWAQEVVMRKEKIIDEINTKAGKKIIKNLRTQLKT